MIGTSRLVSRLAGGEYVVGEFEGPGGQPYVLVVNKSLKASCLPDLQFNTPGTIQVVNSFSGTVHNWSGECKWFAPGQGMLLTLKR